MKLYLSLIFFVFFSAGVIAQKVDTLSPGQILPRWSNLKEQVSKYSIFSTAKDGKLLFFALSERTVKPYTFNGKETWIFIQTSYSKDNIDTDSTIFLPKTYVPVAYRTHIPTEKHREKVDFDGTKITAEITYADSVVTKDQSAAYPLYSTVMDELILQALPFKKGAKFAIKSLNPGAHYRGVVVSTYEVVGDERLDVGGTPIDCWKVATRKSIIWYSKKTQELIKHQYIYPNGNVWMKVKII
jgi:hypothetical protein